MLDQIKQIIADQFPYAEKGLFFFNGNENQYYYSGDAFFPLYGDANNKVQLWICPAWEYFLAVGFSDEQKEELTNFYHKLREG